MHVLDYVKALRELGARVSLTGSRVLGDQPNSDWDYLVEEPRITVNTAAYLIAEGFTKEGGEPYPGQDPSLFTSWRKGDVNFLVTNDPDFADRHRAATSLLKRFQLHVKADRIALFKAVLYGEEA